MDQVARARPVEICLLALPEVTGSVLYGLYDVLSSVGTVWRQLTGEGDGRPRTQVRIVAPSGAAFQCYNGVPVAPHAGFAEVGEADIAIVPDLAIDPEADPRGRWPEAGAWLRKLHARGATVCSVCTGSVLLAESGLLDGEEATTHWGVTGLIATYYPSVRLRQQRIMVSAGPEHRLITAGGVASWEDLALYLIGRFCGGTEAVRAAKIYILGDRSDGQLPFAAMARPKEHADAAIAACQGWIAENYALPNPVSTLIARSGIPERSFKRRFRAATGYAPMDYVQTLRIEEAKQLLETTDLSADEVGAAIGYSDPAFFRRLFKRRTGVTPGRYRRRFQPLSVAGGERAGRRVSPSEAIAGPPGPSE